MNAHRRGTLHDLTVWAFHFSTGCQCHCSPMPLFAHTIVRQCHCSPMPLFANAIVRRGPNSKTLVKRQADKRRPVSKTSPLVRRQTYQKLAIVSGEVVGIAGAWFGVIGLIPVSICLRWPVANVCKTALWTVEPGDRSEGRDPSVRVLLR